MAKLQATAINAELELRSTVAMKFCSYFVYVIILLQIPGLDLSRWSTQYRRMLVLFVYSSEASLAVAFSLKMWM